MTRLRYVVRPVTTKVAAGDVGHVDLADVEGGGVGQFSVRLDVDRGTEALLLEPGDLAVSKLRPYLRKGFMADRTLTCSTEFLCFRPRETWGARYLAYVFLSNDFAQFAMSTVEGTRMPRTGWEAVREFDVTACTVSDQVAIADFLDRECSRIRALEDELLTYATSSQAWLQARTEEVLWATSPGATPLRRLGCKCVTGPFGTALSASEYVDGGVPLVNPTHIVGGRIITSSHESVSLTVATRLSRYRLASGDLIVGRKGDIGRAALVGEEEDGYICGSDSIALRSNVDVLDPGFVAALFRTARVRDGLRARSSGATLANMNERNLLAVEVPTIDVTDQVRRCAEVELLRGRRTTLEQELEQLRFLVAEYRDALITEVVTGKLDITKMSESRMAENLSAAHEGEWPEVLS